jgi:hypothetical protein
MLPPFSLKNEAYASLLAGGVMVVAAHLMWRNTNVRRARAGALPVRPPSYLKVFAVTAVGVYVLMMIFSRSTPAVVVGGGGEDAFGGDINEILRYVDPDGPDF